MQTPVNALDPNADVVAFRREKDAMAPPANGKDFLAVGELSCPEAPYAAISTSERIAVHTLNVDAPALDAGLMANAG